MNRMVYPPGLTNAEMSDGPQDLADAATCSMAGKKPVKMPAALGAG